MKRTEGVDEKGYYIVKEGVTFHRTKDEIDNMIGQPEEKLAECCRRKTLIVDYHSCRTCKHLNVTGDMFNTDHQIYCGDELLLGAEKSNCSKWEGK